MTELDSSTSPPRSGAPQPSAPATRRRRLVTTALRVTGWILLSAGGVVLLYIVYTLLFTGVATQAAQRGLEDEWRREVGEIADAAGALPTQSSDPSPSSDPTPGSGHAPPAEQPPGPPPRVNPGEALAVIQFFRPGSQAPVVIDEPLFVIEGVALEDLTKGPGHYPDSALPGQPGNFAVAGHRTTYAAPFFHLDALTAGDEIHVTDRAGSRFVYRVVEQQVVAPWELWVIDPDPLETGERMLTLTTCHPRFSARQRLIVFAQLVSEQPA